MSRPASWTALFLCCIALPPSANATVAEPVHPGLERISTAVPWPRGLRFLDGQLVVLGRGVHRSAGGPQAGIDDQAGHLFRVDPAISEAVVTGETAGAAVRANATIFARPTDPPFRLWTGLMPATSDMHTDRPYCMLIWDAPSQNFFICGYSGIDLATPARFRKNATDSILRYDLRDRHWHLVERHDPTVVPPEALGQAVPARFYPHHDVATNDPPHGLVSGPCGAVVAGRYLYCGAKDNTALAQYRLDDIRRRPDAGPPPGRLIFHRSGSDDEVYLATEGHGQVYVEGTCALAVHESWLYISFRTTSQILRFALAADGDLLHPLRGQYIAQFPRYDPDRDGGSANIYDLAFDQLGRLYVSAGYTGCVYRFTPDPDKLFQAEDGTYGPDPYVDLRALTDHPRSRAGNICLDQEGNLYIATGNQDVADGQRRGTIYRWRAR